MMFDKEKVEDLITSDKIAEAIKLLRKMLPNDSPFSDDLVIISSEEKRISKDESLSLVDYAKISIQKNRLNFKIIKLLDQIDKYRSGEIDGVQNKNEKFPNFIPPIRPINFDEFVGRDSELQSISDGLNKSSF